MVKIKSLQLVTCCVKRRGPSHAATGHPLDDDLNRAEIWYRKAADAGVAKARELMEQLQRQKEQHQAAAL